MSNPKMPDLNALMRQAQRLQADVAKAQEEVATMTADGQAGGGMVTVTVNGNFELVKVKLDQAVVDPADVAMLEDLITAAVNAANARMREVTKQHMSKVMGGMNIPGMPGMPF
ncbi:MAG: YbaB/EbfC family nucleoid-associated protein [Kofleriaceae bacterium]|nr:YbaB/EbfC family nucleoid-associated protein [Kofleriaceae bacterium]MCL4226818.1 YbaB/EbfC family nucleoid-associated protein [Myxococcales bacterium]